nr:YfhO family protein [Bacilli bacterium]
MRLGKMMWLRKSLPILALLVMPILGHLPSVLGLVNSDPFGTYGWLSSQYMKGFLPGYSYADPNVGFTTQALGHLAAMDWLHGKIPWWNPYEGVGFPLAGEMQSAALFLPFVLLLAFSNGVLLMHLVLSMIAGIFMFLFLRKLDFSVVLATAGGILFELCGAMAWMGHAPYNPIAFLPMMLLGVEIAWRKEGPRLSGWFWLALGIGFSLYAGFPETAYLNSLFVIGWIVVRFFAPSILSKRVFVFRVVIGGIVGLLLAAPILIAFIDFVRIGYLGGHSGAFAYASLPTGGLEMLVLPYLFGPITAFSSLDPTGIVSDTWANIGGYAGILLVTLAVFGVIAKGNRAIRFYLLGVIIFFVGKTYGVTPLTWIVNLLPGIKNVAFFRYAPTVWEFAFILLALYGLQALKQFSFRQLIGGLIASFIVLAGLLSFSLPYMAPLQTSSKYRLFSEVYLGVLVLIIVSFVLVLLRKQWRYRMLIAASLLIVEAYFSFLLPKLSNPKSYTIDQAAITYLSTHLHDQRFYTLGPFAPNYGSYEELASINHNDLPVPKLWATYVTQKLDTNTSRITFVGWLSKNPQGNTPEQALFENFKNYQDLGVRYIVAPATASLVQDTISNQQPASGNQPFPLGQQDRLSGALSLGHAGTIRSIAFLIATYNNTATGTLSLTLRDGQQQERLIGSLRHAADNAFFTFPLTKPMTIRPGSILKFTLQKSAGKPIAVWLWPRGTSPTEQLVYDHQDMGNKILLYQVQRQSKHASSLTPVYQDPLLTIYRVQGAKPMFSITSGSGIVASPSLSTVQVKSTEPITLLRRELNVPGWTASIDGKPSKIQTTDTLFQAIRVPKGVHTIRFRYVPPYMPIGFVFFLLGVLSLFVLFLNKYISSRRRLRESVE